MLARDATPHFDRVLCANCGNNHWATDWACPFYQARFNTVELAKLQKERVQRICTACLAREGPRRRSNRGATTFTWFLPCANTPTHWSNWNPSPAGGLKAIHFCYLSTPFWSSPNNTVSMYVVSAGYTSQTRNKRWCWVTTQVLFWLTNVSSYGTSLFIPVTKVFSFFLPRLIWIGLLPFPFHARPT